MVFVEADVQFTQYTVGGEYSAYDCTQLLPCGPMETLEVQGKSECVLQALMNGTDIFVYREDDKSCLLCLQAYGGGGITEVHSSHLVYVEGLQRHKIEKLYCIIWT